MNASFTSALPKRLPSNTTRTDPHFRRRSHNIALKQIGEDAPHSPSMYPPSIPHQPGASPFDDIIEKLRDPPYRSRLGDVSQITLSRPSSFPDSGNFAVASSQSPGTSFSGRKGWVLLSPSSPISRPWNSLLSWGRRPSSFVTNSNPRKGRSLAPPELDDVHASERIHSYPLDETPDFDLPSPFDPLLTTTSVRLVDPFIAATCSTNPYVSPESLLYPDYSQQQLTSPKPPALFKLPHNVTFADYGLPSPRLFSSIARHTSNFTRKFPLPWRSVDRFNTKEYIPLLEQDGGDNRLNGLYFDTKLREPDGYGLDGDSIDIGRWTPHKWALVLSVSVVRMKKKYW